MHGRMSADETNPLDSTIGVGMRSLTRAFETSSCRAWAGLGGLGRSSMAWTGAAAGSLLLLLCGNVKSGERRGNLCHSPICLAGSKNWPPAIFKFCTKKSGPPTKHFQTGLLCTKTKHHQKSESIAHPNRLRLRWERRIGWISCTCLLLVPLC